MNKVEELYRQNKRVGEIAELLNLPVQDVEEQVIAFKMAHFNKNEPHNILQQLLIADKTTRIEKIHRLSEEEKRYLRNELHHFFHQKKQNPEDTVLVIWLIGEMHFEEFTEILCQFTASKNGNIKRMVYSAMGKIRNSRFIPYLKMGCKDDMVQVRMYSLKSLMGYSFEQKSAFFQNLLLSETDLRNQKIIKEWIGENSE